MPESTAGYLRSGFQQRGPGRGWIFASDQLTEMAFKATGKDKVTEEGRREGSERWVTLLFGVEAYRCPDPPVWPAEAASELPAVIELCRRDGSWREALARVP